MAGSTSCSTASSQLPQPLTVDGRSTGAQLQLQEAQVHSDLGVGGSGRSAQQALGRQTRVLAQTVLGRVLWSEYAELPSELVLGRGGPVGIEQVALVEHGVGDAPGLREAHGTPSGTVAGVGGAAASRDSIVASQVVRPWAAW